MEHCIERKAVAGQGILDHIVDEMNVGVEEALGLHHLHPDADAIFKMYEMKSCTSERVLEAAGDHKWVAYPVEETETEDQLEELAGLTLNLHMGLNILGDWIILVGDNGMDLFYFAFKKEC